MAFLKSITKKNPERTYTVGQYISRYANSYTIANCGPRELLHKDIKTLQQQVYNYTITQETFNKCTKIMIEANAIYIGSTESGREDVTKERLRMEQKAREKNLEDEMKEKARLEFIAKCEDEVKIKEEIKREKIAKLISEIEKCTVGFYHERYSTLYGMECSYGRDIDYLKDRVSEKMITQEFYENHLKIINSGYALAIETRKK